MSGRAVRKRNRASLYRGKPDERTIVTPETRQALAEMMEQDPAWFVKVCVKVRVVSLRQIPAWIDLAVSPCPADRFRAAEIAALAAQYGIQHKR